MSDWIAHWLVDTFLYTGVLIGAVLLLRRPVSRKFGPQVAYALWALPLLRLAMPPLVLPAWMAPSVPPGALGAGFDPGAAAGEPMLIYAADTAAAADAATTVASAPTVLATLADLAVPLWLAGAVLFLAWRAQAYLAMRRVLLAQARPVGEAGGVRLVETPAVASPVAFGVRDKVVALPPLFMALRDREARDMAIAHELAHHRGRDLLANIAAQPLLALHWFNPLAWAGWRAMRRDQEAACDARVVAGRGRGERALYAAVIAGFAAGDNRLALAAPMACPVLGEKSIVHRLRSLSMSDISERRRRAGLAAVGAVALGLPLTASISYAAPQPPEPPAAPLPPEAVAAVAPLAPLAPEAPLAADGTAVPQPPAAPAAPAALEAVDPDEAGFDGEGWRGPDMERIALEIERGNRERERAMAEVRRALAEQDRALSEAGRERVAALAEARRAIAEAGQARAEAIAATAEAVRAVPQVSTVADCDGDEPVIETTLADGRESIVICTSAINAQAIAGLREAREEIASDEDMPRADRARALRELDRQIERMQRGSRRQVSFRAALPAGAVSAVSFSLQVSAARTSEECAPGAALVA